MTLSSVVWLLYSDFTSFKHTNMATHREGKRPRVSPTKGSTTSATKSGTDSVEKLIERQSRVLLESLNKIENGLRAEIRGAGARIQDMDEKINDIIDSLKFTGAEVEKMKTETIPKLENEMKKQNQELHGELERLQLYVARENMVFYGIPEADGEVTTEVVNAFLKSSLHMNEEAVDAIEFQRCHRVPAPSRPRPIKARVLRFQDKMKILESAHNLKGTRMAISDDLPMRVRRERKMQMRVLKEARNAGMKAHFSRQEPAKLMVDGKHLPRQKQDEFLETLLSRRQQE